MLHRVARNAVNSSSLLKPIQNRIHVGWLVHSRNSFQQRNHLQLFSTKSKKTSDWETRLATGNVKLFEEVASTDFLGFSFSGKSYTKELEKAIASTKEFAGVSVELRAIKSKTSDQTVPVVYVTHNWGFFGGSLGSAEGERLTRAFEYATEQNLPVVVQCKSGGARMQEGTVSLMQISKVAVAINAHREAGLPYVSVLDDPTYGGASASYGMQSDIKIGIAGARIGFAGPNVILNTMFGMDQGKFDAACPEKFQLAEYLKEHGQIDVVIPSEVDGKKVDITQSLNETLYKVISPLFQRDAIPELVKNLKKIDFLAGTPSVDPSKAFTRNYTEARHIGRYQTQDLFNTVFTDFIELTGDGRVGMGVCMKGGLAKLEGMPVMALGPIKGHTALAMKDVNFGMPVPAGYRTAQRLMKIAERFGIPVVTIIDTCGAYPSIAAEEMGQSEAIATNLLEMSGLKVPIITVILGEGGSGGAMAIGMGNKVGMLSNAYYGVISPEGAASILGRYKDDAHKKEQFPKDCHELATVQKIYPDQLKEIGIVDEIIHEQDGEDYRNFPVATARLKDFLAKSIAELSTLSPEQLVTQRYNKFRSYGQFAVLSEAEREQIKNAAIAANPVQKKERAKIDYSPNGLAKFIAEKTVLGDRSRYRGLAPAGVPKNSPAVPKVKPTALLEQKNAKQVLDEQGPEALSTWIRNKKRVLVTDTTMRDAHQSLLATRVRTEDLVKSASLASKIMPDAFSLECWGGATFDVSYRFLNEDPWERLRRIREAAPNLCLQMLIRGSNSVGYAASPDNVIKEFVRLAAKNGLDIFRIFDCFNDVDQMKISIDTVREYNKFAEVCACYTEDITTSEIYNSDYYKKVAEAAAKAGAHAIGIKDMAGLCKPLAAEPLIRAIRSVTDLPIHFHTHATSGASLATLMEVAKAGCDVVDACTASMADGTSQPSLNAFLASMAGHERSPGMDYLSLEPYDIYWAKVRDMYSPFESGMLSGTARVYDHEIPGGQYSNLIVQCKDMGLWHKWEEVLDMYRDVNKLFGRVIKVTPSSKCVGDLALYLVTRGLTCEDVMDPEKSLKIDFPESTQDLMVGMLGRPHRGFPEQLEKIVLKGKPKMTDRAGAILPPADFAKQKIALEEKFGPGITDEDVNSSFIYPKVFSDYKSFTKKYGDFVTRLSTPVFWYGMEVGDTTAFSIPKNAAASLNIPVPPNTTADEIPVTLTLKRITPVMSKGMRTVIFDVNGVEQRVEIQGKVKEEAFQGPLADAKNRKHLGSPMPGTVEKISVSVGDSVVEGQTIATVGAMKMEVQVKAPGNGRIKKIITPKGSKVVEGALMLEFE
jgi:acetyl-CoA carboxylase carboxyl transferase alpha subunit